MGATIVLYVSEATPATISTFNDQLSNQLPKILGRWSFEYKIYRKNAASDPPHTKNVMGSSISAPLITDPAVLSTMKPGDEKFMYTLSLGQFPGSLFSVHDKGMGTILEGDFEEMIQTKLKSLWTQRQALKGEGYAYELDDGQFVVRVGNVLLQGLFKGMLIEVEHVTIVDNNSTLADSSFGGKQHNQAVLEPPLVGSGSGESLNKLRNFIYENNFPKGQIYLGDRFENKPFTKLQTAWQYIEALRGP
ncbi:TATA-binding related factor [Nadsonia fulvescens var. elongata DSM 6958]|uniref:Mediator of RNA polymerase II transcription subunit 20 n=1 Tax=Nadsonia fulvescens var. elongata DSM 6958 TaxID=857566 RepID=A0A1E3PGD6_9ASCO|nr:TATA-binding related factor [Nadsonia fulvescens var. elongata DSM 6958]